MHFAGSWMVANYKEEITDFEWGYRAVIGVTQLDIRDQLIEVLAGKISVEEYLEEMNELIAETINDL